MIDIRNTQPLKIWSAQFCQYEVSRGASDVKVKWK